MKEEQYTELVRDLRDTLEAVRVKPIEADDNNLNHAVATEAENEDEEYNNRNKLYTQLLETYIDNYKRKENSKRIYKGIFFTVTILLFVGITTGSMISIILLSVYGDGSLANVGIAIANIVTIISTIIVLPKIIAEHLFPTNEEGNMLEMVKNMQDNDASIRSVLYKDEKEE